MGMTKRLAECVLTTFDTPTVFVSVRFGNVLGSAGSVLPLFQWQIMNGGPVTVTEPEATRYFMLIGEAVQLVLQAGAMARGGEIYFLDMGEPLKIMELANSMIHLSGLSPDRDMPIEVTGLRAGERLSEELVRETERFLESAHEHVFVVQGQAIEPRLFLHDLEPLRASVDQRHRGNTVELLTALTARYQ